MLLLGEDISDVIASVQVFYRLHNLIYEQSLDGANNTTVHWIATVIEKRTEILTPAHIFRKTKSQKEYAHSRNLLQFDENS